MGPQTSCWVPFPSSGCSLVSGTLMKITLQRPSPGEHTSTVSLAWVLRAQFISVPSVSHNNRPLSCHSCKPFKKTKCSRRQQHLNFPISLRLDKDNKDGCWGVHILRFMGQNKNSDLLIREDHNLVIWWIVLISRWHWFCVWTRLCMYKYLCHGAKHTDKFIRLHKKNNNKMKFEPNWEKLLWWINCAGQLERRHETSEPADRRENTLIFLQYQNKTGGGLVDVFPSYLVFFSIASVSWSLETHFSNWSITSVPLSSKNADIDLVNSASLQLFDFPSVKETLRVYWSSNLKTETQSGVNISHRSLLSTDYTQVYN